MSTLAELGITEDEWARLHRLNQVGIPDDVSPAVVLAEVRRIVSGEDAPYDELPPFDRLADLIGWLDQRGSIKDGGHCMSDLDTANAGRMLAHLAGHGRICANCGLPIRPEQGSPTGWTHGKRRDAPDWQGKRCPGEITGATPKVTT